MNSRLYRCVLLAHASQSFCPSGVMGGLLCTKEMTQGPGPSSFRMGAGHQKDQD